MTSTRRRLPWLVAFATVLLVPMTMPAGAHVHPTPTELAAPGVVFVQAGARVEVALVEHQRPAPHLTIVQSTSNPVLASASGFVVDPTGAVVTSGEIRKPTGADLDRARIYAVNDAFRKQYGSRVHLSDDLFSPQRIGSDTDPLQQRLEACYPPNRTNDAGGCVVSVTPTYVVYPHVTDQAKYGQLTAELLDSSTSDVALLRVRAASGLPTVPLGDSTEGAQALAALGFDGIPGKEHEERTINAHLAETGGTVFKTENLDEKETKASVDLAARLKAGMRGGPLVAESGRVVGFAVPEADSGPPPATPGRLVDAAAIQKVLKEAGVTPRPGPVDTTFERASHNFKNKAYADSIPDLKQTLELFPGHAVATADLAVAEQNVAQGNPGPATPAEGSPAATGSGATSPWIVVLAVAAAVLVLAAVALIVLRRRRKASGPGDGSRDGTPPPGPPKPPSGKPGTVKTREGTPREATPGSPSRTEAGLRERPKVPSGVAGAGAVSVIEGRGAEHGGSPSRSVPGQRAAGAAGEGSPGESRASATPAAEDSQAFCTYCGAALGTHHKFCGRCGRPTG
jgi:LPXTG-motif cell wall-anchored protein